MPGSPFESPPPPIMRPTSLPLAEDKPISRRQLQFRSRSEPPSKFRSIAGIRIDDPVHACIVDAFQSPGSHLNVFQSAPPMESMPQIQTGFVGAQRLDTSEFGHNLKVDVETCSFGDNLNVGTSEFEGMHTLEINDIPKQEVRVSMNAIFDSWRRQKTAVRQRKRPEVQRIADLHDLIKKQTILVCIALCTDLIYIGIIFFEPIEWMIGWLYFVNVICVWMMLGISKRYWICCKQYAFCYCCYHTSNRLKF